MISQKHTTAIFILLAACLLSACNRKTNNTTYNKSLFEYNDNIETRWSSGENRNGVKGAGGKENNMAKGHPWDSIPSGASEGRSFNSFIQMPFRKAAKIVITNESEKTLNNIFFDVDYSLLKTWNDDYLYFHAYWHRDTATKLANDFELLPQVTGKGRFLGVNIGVNGNPLYKKSWFGEGEVKNVHRR